jgi:hypothetical protein
MKFSKIIINMTLILSLVVVVNLIDSKNFSNRNKQEGDIVNVEQAKEKPQSLINDNNLYVAFNNYNVKVQFKYTKTESMWIGITNNGVNRIFNFQDWYISNNLNAGAFESTRKVMSSTSDWISPVQVAAISDINGDDIDGTLPKFTGGAHGYNGDASGTPTGRQLNTEFFVDGKMVSSSYKTAKEFKIISTQRIQAWNTKKLDGSGREVLEQVVTYTFKGNHIDVVVRTKALENVDWTLWYGLQVVHSLNSNWDGTVSYKDGNPSGKQNNIDNDSGSKSVAPNIYRFENRGIKGDIISAWIDTNYGLGKRQYVSNNKPLGFNKDYGKSYFNIIKGENLEMQANDIVILHGGYEFYKDED